MNRASMEDKALEKKLKIERVVICLNCQLFTDCDLYGRFEECERFVEVEHDNAMVIVSLNEYAASELRRS
jgi:hypothetical protein